MVYPSSLYDLYQESMQFLDKYTDYAVNVLTLVYHPI